jgi:hypothetical protein
MAIYHSFLWCKKTNTSSYLWCSVQFPANGRYANVVQTEMPYHKALLKCGLFMAARHVPLPSPLQLYIDDKRALM